MRHADGPAAGAGPGAPVEPARGALSLRRNVAWTFVGGVVASGSRFAMLAILARLASKQAVGAFSIALAVCTLITILSQLQLRVALVTDAADEHPFGAYRALRLVATVAAVLVASTVALVAYREIALLVVLIACGQGITSLRDLWEGLAQKHERMDIASTGNMIDALLSSALFCLLFLVTDHLEWAAVGLIVGRLLTLTVYDVPRVRSVVDIPLAPLWDLVRMRHLFRVALPLGLTTALVSLNSNLPRFFIEGLLGKDALAVFALIAYFTFLGQLFTGALSRSASPRLALLYRRDRARYGGLLIRLVLCSVALGAAGMLIAAFAGDIILGIAYGADYAEHGDLLVLLMAANAVLLVNSFLGVAISAARFFRIQTATCAAVVATTLVGCALLIPTRGIAGAAWAMIGAACVNMAINAGVFVHVYRRP